MVDHDNDAFPEKSLRQKVLSWLTLLTLWTVQYWKELLNFRFDRYMIAQVIPGFYGLILLSIAALLLYSTAIAFSVGVLHGLFFLLVVTPLGFLLGASIARGILELYLVVFRISENLDELVGIRDTVDRLSGISEAVDQMTRRIPFWSSLSNARARNERNNRHRPPARKDKKEEPK